MPEREMEKGSQGTENTKPRQKKLLRIGGFLLAVAVVAGLVFVLFLRGNGAAPVTTGGETNGAVSTAEDEDAEVVEVLPQSKREMVHADDMVWFGQDPFASPMRLAGIISGGRGGTMAIVESGSIAYVVSAGDMIDELWIVVHIDGNSILLSSAEREIELRLHQRVGEPDEDPVDQDEASAE